MFCTLKKLKQHATTHDSDTQDQTVPNNTREIEHEEPSSVVKTTEQILEEEYLNFELNMEVPEHLDRILDFTEL